MEDRGQEQEGLVTVESPDQFGNTTSRILVQQKGTYPEKSSIAAFSIV